MSKMRARYSGEIPIPLSRWATIQRLSSRDTEMWICGESSRRNLIALLSRFWNSCTSCASSAATVGRGSWVIPAPLSRVASRRFPAAWATTLFRSVGSCSLARVSTRE